ncbi:hypothetical protein [Janthinobacterium fluminis]|uniref:Uncharacterized protein n=1 Tax=Janthinobacterium fluminis TaxID=2987524 RepID=A0ABT5K9B1_9BURK|nr:hypothetical protein [Janthinobacterium fluminis]MDC8760661.1 hypothetical protein [Janthinobacterium fluminis]
MNNTESLRHIAIVSETARVGFDEVARVSAALQKQMLRDFSPIWGVQATVDAFASLDDVPIDYWPILVQDDIGVDGAWGIHKDKDGQPFGLVRYSPTWSLTASHEELEMLCDPAGNRLQPGKSPMPGQGRVRFLVEVCDPSEAHAFAYPVNGITVSDFYTPRYFDPVTAPGTRYSFTGAITEPRQVLPGGYLSWHDTESDHWFQKIHFGSEPEFRDLGQLSDARESIRSQIYARTPEASKLKAPGQQATLTASAVQREVATASRAKVHVLRAQIDALLRKK